MLIGPLLDEISMLNCKVIAIRNMTYNLTQSVIEVKADLVRMRSSIADTFPCNTANEQLIQQLDMVIDKITKQRDTFLFNPHKEHPHEA